MRRLLVVLAALAAAALLVPTAQAAEARYEMKRNDGHPADHIVEIPENHRYQIPLETKLLAKDFVCATEAKWKFVLVIADVPQWAGFSLQPDNNVEVTIPGGAPAAQEGEFPGDEVTLDIFWDEEFRPKTNAMYKYVIKTGGDQQPVIEGGPCLPGANVPEATLQITLSAADILPENATAMPKDCDEDPFQPACQTETAEPAESPGFDAIMLVGAALGIGFLRRHRSK